MIYQIEKIKRDVRVALDQNMVSETLFAEGDVDTLSVDEIIESKIIEGVERIHKSAPVYLLESGHHFGESLFWGDRESGWVLLPDDFMRLVVFRMSDWERSVYSAESADSPAYIRRHSRYKGIRGTAQRPVCVLGVRPEGKVLEFYSCRSEEAEVSEGVYLPYPRIDAGGGVDISERCYGAVVYMIAALAVATYGDTAKTQLFMELSKSALE